MARQYTVHYYDDEAGVSSGDVKRLTDRLSLTGELSVTAKRPPSAEVLGSALYAEPPDLFLIDYQLSRVQVDGSAVGYRGTTLADSLRDAYPDIPIVIITRRSIMESQDTQTRRRLSRSTVNYDALILKEQLANDAISSVVNLLVGLADGYLRLRTSVCKDWSNLIAALSADDSEAELLQEAVPPLAADRTWVTWEAANWVRGVLFRYPGVLYDSVSSATSLGISREAFLEGSIQQLLGEASYTGVFHRESRRWWKERLLAAATGFADARGCDGPLGEAFPRAFAAAYARQLPLAVCVWDGTPTPDRVCAVLSSPVKTEHTLRYYPDSRPSVMDEARVSFRAIRESNDFDEHLLDARGLRLLARIEALPDPRER